jgi:hypothetical protein
MGLDAEMPEELSLCYCHQTLHRSLIIVLLAELCHFASWFCQMAIAWLLAERLGQKLAELSVKCVGILVYNPDMALLVPFIMFQ